MTGLLKEADKEIRAGEKSTKRGKGKKNRRVETNGNKSRTNALISEGGMEGKEGEEEREGEEGKES